MNKYGGIYQDTNNGSFYVKTKARTKDGFIISITKRGFYNKTDAFNYKIKRVEEIQNSYNFEQNNQAIKLYDFFDLYLQEYSISFSESSVRRVTNQINKYYKPNLPNKPMNALKPSVFAQYRAFISNLNNLTSDTKNEYIGSLKRILQSAIDKAYLDNKLGRLCMLELKPVANDGHTINNDYWEIEEYQAFINSFESTDKYRLLFRCLFAFGCRLGEFRGLQWKDLSTADNTIHIHKQVTSKLGHGKWIIIPTTKTKKDRYTTIPQNLVNELIEFKLANNYTDNDFIFFGSKPISENSINTQKAKHCKLANVKYIRNHDFRHSNITYMIDSGVDLKVVASQVGHTNVATTLNTYNHISTKRKDKLKEVLDNSNL